MRPPKRRPDRDAGFTLLEILVVIAILGLLVGLVAPAALRQLGGAQNAIARQSIQRIGGVLDLYKLDMNTYPSTEQGLQALVIRPSGATAWNGPYLKSDQMPLLDPWNRPFSYRSPTTRAGRDYDLCSRGPNAPANGAEAQEGMICN